MIQSKKDMREAMQEVEIRTDEGKEFLNKYKDPSSQTAEDYERRIKYYLAYRGKNCEDLIDEAEDDWGKSKRDRDFVSEHHLNNFITKLKELGYSKNTQFNILATMRAFYQFHQFPLNSDRLKKVKTANKNHYETIEKDDVRRLYNSTTNNRNKALLLFLYQTGQSVKQIIELDYGDVKKELEEGKEPLMLRYSERKESGNEYVAFLGSDGIEALKKYLDGRDDLDYKDPLFVKSKGKGRITRSSVPMALQYMAKGADLVDDEYLENNRNPYRPSAFRKNFKTTLTGKAHDFVVEFLMGHATGIENVYFVPDVNTKEDLREYYAEYIEPELSIHTTATEKQAIVSGDVEFKKEEEIKEMVEEEMEEEVETWKDKWREERIERRVLEESVEKLSERTKELENLVGKEEELAKRYSSYEDKLREMDKIKERLKLLEKAVLMSLGEEEWQKVKSKLDEADIELHE